MKQKALGCIIWLAIFFVIFFGAPSGLAMFTDGDIISIIIGCIILIVTGWLVYILIKANKRIKNSDNRIYDSNGTKISKKDLAKNIAEQYGLTDSRQDNQDKLSLYDQKQKEKILVDAFKITVSNLLNDGSVNEDVAANIIAYYNELGISTSRLMKENEYVQLSKLVVINCVLSGRIPAGMHAPSNVFINFENNEDVVLSLDNATYYELVEVKTRVGYSAGHSIRVSKGFYLRSGSFFSTPITSQQLQKKGEGALCITTKNIYFCSSTKTVKLPFSKIVSYDSYSDGLGVHLSDSRRRPIVIGKIDGWFVYNIVTNIRNIIM